MKRTPRPGEPKLSHYTVDTQDEQTIAICDENHNPTMIGMLVESLPVVPVGDWLIQVFAPDSFVVSWRNAPVSTNRIEYLGNSLRLTTKLLRGSSALDPETGMILSDLEQCVALALRRRKPQEQQFGAGSA